MKIIEERGEKLKKAMDRTTGPGTCVIDKTEGKLAQLIIDPKSPITGRTFEIRDLKKEQGERIEKTTQLSYEDELKYMSKFSIGSSAHGWKYKHIEIKPGEKEDTATITATNGICIVRITQNNIVLKNVLTIRPDVIKGVLPIIHKKQKSDFYEISRRKSGGEDYMEYGYAYTKVYVSHKLEPLLPPVDRFLPDPIPGDSITGIISVKLVDLKAALSAMLAAKRDIAKHYKSKDEYTDMLLFERESEKPDNKELRVVAPNDKHINMVVPMVDICPDDKDYYLDEKPNPYYHAMMQCGKEIQKKKTQNPLLLFVADGQMLYDIIDGIPIWPRYYGIKIVITKTEHIHIIPEITEEK